MKPYASELGIFVMFLGLHFAPGTSVSWGEVVAVGALLIGIVLLKVGAAHRGEP